tara:strand:- start:1009 stop:1572 length:564 start_codon:yes stop_codon:yes gene_type:complete
MKKILTIILLPLLFSCTSGIPNLDKAWGIKNQEYQQKFGTRTYQMKKETAMNAMQVAFQKLSLITTQSDFQTGLIVATANAPKPLSYEEYQRVQEVENPTVDEAFGLVGSLFFTWDALDEFESKFSAVFLETGSGVQISLRGNLDFTGDRALKRPVSEFPPEGVRLVYAKIWEEFEKIAFIQNKTLK